MARRNNRGDKTPPFVAMTWNVLNSPAYKELPFSARSALPYFTGKPKCPPTSLSAHTTVFAFSYTEAKGLGFARGTWAHVIRNLVANGFIDPIEKGGLRGAGFSGNQFRLSKRWQDYGKPSFVCVTWEEFFSRKAS